MPNNNNKDKKWADDMIEEIAEVKSVGQGFAEIQPENTGGCSGCSSNASCSSSSLTTNSFSIINFFTGATAVPRTLKVQNPVYAKPGDTVVVGVRSSTVLKGSMLAYMLPLFTLIIFSALGNILFSNFGMNAEIGSILVGLLGLYTGFQIVAMILKNSSVSHDFEAVILRIVEPEGHSVSFSLST